MNNEALVDQIVRSLSFEVVAVPQNVRQVDSTSKSTPLNVKIRVRKKYDAGLRHGVLSMPKVDTKKNSGEDSVPERIRLVSSDQTIMSFNVLMEADFDKVPPKYRKQNMNMVSSGLGINNKDRCLPKDTDLLTASPIISKKNKDIFGRCKPGGCLDPPYGEEKYSYQPKQQNILLPVKDDSTKLRSSSIFKNKIFKRKKKSCQDDDDFNKTDMKNTTEEDSILCSNETGSLQTPTVYSNSIITYPHPSNSGELFVQADKTNKKRYSCDDKSRSSVIEDPGSYFILPNKIKKQANQSDMNKKQQSNVKTRDSNLNNKQVNDDLNKPEFKNIPRTKEPSLDNELKNKQCPSKIDEIKFNSKDPKFIPIPLLVPLSTVIENNNKDNIDNLKRDINDEKFKIRPSLENTMPTKNETDAETKTHSQTELFTIYDDGNYLACDQNKHVFQQNAFDKVPDEVCFTNSDSSLPEKKTLNYTNDITDFLCSAEKSINSENQQNHPVIDKNDASQDKQKEIIAEDRKILSIHSLNEKQGDVLVSDPIVLQELRNDKNSNVDFNLAGLATNSQKLIVVTKSCTDYSKDGDFNLADQTDIRSHPVVSSKEKSNLDITTNISKKVREISRQSSNIFKFADKEANIIQNKQKEIISEDGSFLVNNCNRQQGNISEPTILQNNENGDTDIIQTRSSPTNKNILSINKSSFNHIKDDKNNSDLNNGDKMDITSHTLIFTKEESNLGIINLSKQLRDSLTQNRSGVLKLSENEEINQTVPCSTTQDMHENTYSKDGIRLSIGGCYDEIRDNIFEPTIFQEILNVEKDASDISQPRSSETNQNFITVTKSNISHIINDRNISDVYYKDQVNIISNPLVSTEEKSFLDNTFDLSKPMRENSMQNSSDVLKLFENKNHIGTIPYINAHNTQKKYYSEDGKSLSIDSHKEIQRKISKPVMFQETQNIRNGENLITTIKCSMDLIKDGQSNSGVYNVHQIDTKSHSLLTTKEKSILDITYTLSMPVNSTQNVNNVFETYENEDDIKTISYSTEDLHHIWGNEAEPLISKADFITKTTLPLAKSNGSIKYARGELQLLSFENISNKTESIQENQLETYPIEDSIKQREAKKLHETMPVTETKPVSQSDPHASKNKREGVTQDLIENFEKILITNENFTEETLKNVQNKNPGAFFSEINKTNSNVSPENMYDGQLFDLKDSAELSKKLSIVTFESATANLKKEGDFFDEQNKLSKKSSIDPQSATLIQRKNILDDYDINYRSFESKETLKNTSLIRFTKDEMITKDFIESEENGSAQSILKHKFSKDGRASETLNNKYVQNSSSRLNKNLPKIINYKDKVQYLVERNELTAKQSSCLVSDRVEPELTNRYKDIDEGKKSWVSLDQLSSNEISEVLNITQQPSTMLRKRVVPWKIDIALQSYIDENNEKIIKSFDSKNMPERRVNDAILVAQCYLGTESNEIKIPINQETDLSVQIKSSKCPNLSIIELNENASITDQTQCKKKFEHDIPHQTDLVITADHTDNEDVNKSDVNKINRVISDDLRDALNTIYEQELLPLQDIIKGLREEIDMLVAYQNKFKEKVQKLVPKRPRPLRLVYPNKKCACVRRM